MHGKLVYMHWHDAADNSSYHIIWHPLCYSKLNWQLPTGGGMGYSDSANPDHWQWEDGQNQYTYTRWPFTFPLILFLF